MKAKYNATGNYLEELATIGKPPILLEKFIEGTTEWLATKIRWDEYNAHLATLRRISCHPSCVGKWSDGQELTEGVEYEVLLDGEYAKLGSPSTDDYLRFLFAKPIEAKSDEDLWAELFLHLHVTAQRYEPSSGGFHPGLPNDEKWHRYMIDELKQKYSLTKK